MANEAEVQRYYAKTESRYGYRSVLRGVRHFGFYDPPERSLSMRQAQAEMERLIGHSLQLPAGSVVLDAGCGEGAVAHRLASEFGYHVVGIDIVEESIVRARSRPVPARGSTRFELRSFFDVSGLNTRFDGIYTIETLVHADEPDRVLSGFRKQLRPGGRLALFEYSMAAKELLPKPALKAFGLINSVAAMPAWWDFQVGSWEKRLRGLGYEQVLVRDLTDNMLPMVRRLRRLAFLPYFVARVAKKQHKLINAMSAVELYRYRRYWQYNAVTAVNPLVPSAQNW